MQYLGGKSKIGPQIVELLNSVRKPGQTYIEPFMGGLWVTYLTGPWGCPRFASDSNPYIVTLYKKLQEGWEPPTEISEEQYQHYKKNQDVYDPLTAFIGIGCSFAGKWFGGYARDSKFNPKPNKYAGQAARSLKKKIDRCKDVVFSCMDYKEALSMAPPESLIYLDPPYANTTKYKQGAFNHDEFWNTVREYSGLHDIYISEYTAPDDFKETLVLPTKTSLRTADGADPRIEKVFKWID
jgi:DNA adenine methylase